MGIGPTTTLGFLDAQGEWVPVSEASPLPAGAATVATAGLNTFGYIQGIFIVNGGTLPGGLPTYALVIEQE